MKILVRILITAAFILLIGTIAVLYIVYNSDPAQQEVLEEQSFDADIEDMEITVENSRVDILASTDDTSRIVLSGNDDDFRLSTDVSGGRLIIEVEDRSQFFNFDFNRSYSLQVYVPQNGLASLSVESDNGTIQANDIQTTELEMDADNGRITVDGVDSTRVDVETDNGQIELTDMDANMTVNSSNGRIILTDVSGELEAKANNGRIELITDTLDFPVNFETDNGRIEIQTENEPANARIQARTDNGSINVFGQENEETTFGNGEVLIQLVTSNGSIVVE